jgi:hypothetical protein
MIDYPDRIGADLVWLPARLPVVERLARTGWRKILDTGQSVVLSRNGTQIPYRADAASGPDVFPWP